MGKLDIKNSSFLWGIGLLVLGFLIFVGINNSFRYLGFVFLIVAIIYFIRIFNLKSNDTNTENYKSKTREQVQKYQQK